MKSAIFFLSAQAASSINIKSNMRPDAVAAILEKVEDEWKTQADTFVQCNYTVNSTDDAEMCKSPEMGFGKSCSKIVSTVVQASDGDRDRVTEYLGLICNQKELTTAWKQTQCKNLASDVTSKMSAEAFANREQFDSAGTCVQFWNSFVQNEKVTLDQERAERAAREKKEAEERAAREKQEAEERAAREKKEAEERAEAEKKAAEEKKKAEEEQAKKDAEEKVRIQKEKAAAAQKKAEEAAKKLAEKKAEAEHEEEEAKQKAEEAKKAAEEEEHMRLHVHNTTAVKANQTETKPAPAASAAPVNKTK